MDIIFIACSSERNIKIILEAPITDVNLKWTIYLVN